MNAKTHKYFGGKPFGSLWIFLATPLHLNFGDGGLSLGNASNVLV